MAGYVNPPTAGVDVTPDEYGSSYLRYLSGVNAPQSENLFGAGPTAQSIPEQMAAAETAATTGKTGLIAGARSLPGALTRLATPGNDYGWAEFVAEHPYAQAGIPALIAQLAANPVGHGVTSLTGNKEAGDVSEQAIRGAGYGAGLGAMGGPFAEITAPVGAGIGAVSNVAANAIFNALPGSMKSRTVTKEPQVATGQDSTGAPVYGQWDDVISSDQKVLDGLRLSGIDPSIANGVRDAYNKMKNSGQLDLAHQYIGQVAQAHNPSLPGLPDSTSGLTPDKMLALQQMSTSLMAPYIEQNRQASNAQAAALGAAFSSNDPNIQKINQSLTNITQQGNNALSSAYMIQAQGQPFLNSIGANYYNKGVAAAQTPTSTSGSLASQLTAQQALAPSTLNPTQFNPATYLTAG